MLLWQGQDLLFRRDANVLYGFVGCYLIHHTIDLSIALGFTVTTHLRFCILF